MVPTDVDQTEALGCYAAWREGILQDEEGQDVRTGTRIYRYRTVLQRTDKKRRVAERQVLPLS